MPLGELSARYDGNRVERLTMTCRSMSLFGAALAVGAVSTGLFVGCKRPEPDAPAVTVETAVRFTLIKGRVQVKRAGTLAWDNASLATNLRKDDRVRTAENATAEIRFADGTQLSVRPNSVIIIMDSSRNLISQHPQTALGIQSGEANFQTPAQNGQRKIETPGGRASPERETEGSIQVRPDGKTGISIRRGKSTVETRTGQQLQLGPGEGVQIDAEGKAGPKLPLPEAPPAGVLIPPQLALDAIELRATQLHVTGRTEPGATVTINGEPIPVRQDGSFNEHVVLTRRSTAVSIRATGVNGATTEQQLPLVVPR